MDLEALPVIILVAGIVLLYSGITNRNPLGVIRAALTGKDLASVAPLMAAATSAGPGTISGAQLPGTPQADGDARTDPKGYDPKTQSVIPRLPGERVPGVGNGVV